MYRQFARADVEAMIRLAAELQSLPPDFETRANRMATGLCELVNADTGTVVVLSQLTRSLPASFCETIAAPGQVCTRSTRAPTGECLILSSYRLDHVKRIFCITLTRQAGRRRFTSRDVGIVDLFHRQQTVYELYSARHATLSPRMREVLTLLQDAQSEKEVAATLELSIHTVHVYVKALYRHYGVCSRAELMKLWMGKSAAPDRFGPRPASSPGGFVNECLNRGARISNI